MNKFQAQQVMNGTFGELWVDGDYMAEVTAFEAKVSLDMTDVNMSRRLAKAQKVTGYSCSGSVTLNKVSSYFIKKLNENMKQGKQTVCTIISKLDDPDAIGSERIVIKDAVFSELTLANWSAKSLGEEQLPFSFSEWDILDTAE
ncbi:phage tail tube protein [Zhenhengia yiwuensis]|uniref:Phage tail tube protein n=1 Tax=Zhenhengia yiwuensis TaxID=2763666 RepID=A0A926EIE6_9FIRM|nr:phage tail tube protein [Zhenhengia yiwuensis]MBC8579135.1 phage tail tube protein [Zhenhengia yiwuensis]